MKKDLSRSLFKSVLVTLLSFAGLSLYAQVVPAITSFSPQSGTVGTTVTIIGTGLNVTAANNAVFFGSTKATVQSASGISPVTLLVTVPSGADYRYISVTNLTTGLTGYTVQPFVVTYSPSGSDTFRTKVSLTSGSSANTRFVTLADMNNDGKPDLLVANSDNTISVFPNTITSTTAVASFGSAVTLGTSSGSVSSSLAVGDFDGDGFLDIAAVFSGTSSVSAYRNTTGTAGNTPSFAAAVATTTAATPVGVSIADVDMNGKPDIVVVSSLASNNVSIISGIGLSLGLLVFLPAQTLSAGTNPSAVALGDLDRDGKLDIAIANKGSNNVSVFHNTNALLGTISFGTPFTLTAGTSPTSVAISDLDGDNWLDIVAANSGNGHVSAFRSTSTTGTISFTSSTDLSAGSSSGPIAVAVGDTDGDGKPDLMTANYSNSTVALLRNASSVGSLSFVTSTDVSNASVTSPYSIAVGDINADSKPDFVVSLSGTTNNVGVFLQKMNQSLTVTSASTLLVDGSLSVTVSRSVSNTLGGSLAYSVVAGSGSATVNSSGNLTGVSVGTVTLTVTAAGDSDYASASTTQLVTINKATPTLTITSANSLNVDGALTATTTTSATLGRGGVITYSMVAGSGSATVNSSTGLITGISVGTVTLTANAAGDADYNPASTSQLFIIDQVTPTLTITSANTMVVDGTLTATVTTTATASSGGAYSFAISAGSGSATVNSNGLITATGTGTVTLTVTSAGDTNYTSTSTSQLITIGKSTPTLAITSVNSLNVDGSLTVTTTTTADVSSGGVLSYTVSGGSGSATVDSNGLLVGTGAGTITLTVSSSGDANYNGTSTSQLITIGMSTPSLVITSGSILNVDDSLTVTTTTTADVSSGGVLSYSVSGGSGSATVDSNGLLTAIGAGTVTLTVSSSGDANYNGTSTSQLITIGMSTPSLVITSGSILNVDDSLTVTTTTTADVSSGGVLSYSVSGGSGSATVDSNGLLTAIGAGTVTLTVSSSGDANYNGTSTSQLITIGMSTPSLVITSVATTVVDATLTVTVSTTASHSIGTLSYSIVDDTGAATVDNTGLITAVSAGMVTLTVSSSGNADYNPTSVSQLITIGRATPVITIDSPNTLNVDDVITGDAFTSATLNRGGSFSWILVGGSGSATIDQDTSELTGISVGTVTLTSVTTGDADYYPASTDQLITITKATPTLTFTSDNNVNVDGTLATSVTTSATLGRGGSITYAISGGSGSATVDMNTGVVTGIGTGTVTLIASSTGDTNYYEASLSQEIDINMATPTLTITSSASLVVDQSLTATMTTTATGGRGGVLNYSIVGGSGSATVDNNTGLITCISIGSVTLTTTSSGDTDYYSASTSQLITIGKATPTLTITSVNNLLVDGSLTATTITNATLGRGGLITYSIAGGSGSATVNSSTGLIAGIGAGTVTLTAGSEDDSNYYGTSTSQVLTINKTTPTLAITSSSTINVDDSLTVMLSTTADVSSGGTLSYSVVAGSGSATVNSNGLLTATGAGTVTLTVSSAGDTNYNGTNTSQLITISKTSQTLTITSANELNVDATLMVDTATTADVSSGGTLSYSIVAGSGSATVDSNTGLLTGVSIGTVTVTVTSSGDTNYYGANISQLITINKATPTLTITSSNSTIVDASLTATATTSATDGRGGVITYSIVAGSGSATINSSTGLIHAINAGTITLTAISSGDTDYYSASTSQLITIEKATPTLVITSANTILVDGVLTATVSSSVPNPGTITYSVVNSTGIIIVVSSSGKVTGVQAGASTLKATSAGTSNYYPVTVSQAMTINKATPTLTITSPTGSTMIVNHSLTVTFTTSATLNRGGAKSYAVKAGSGSATINPTTGFMTAVSVGTVTLTVSTAGDANYYAASASKLITITASMLATGSTDSGTSVSEMPLKSIPPVTEESGSLDDHEVAISMVISPNGDGLNDVLIVNHIEEHPANELVIADRNGEMVFKTHGYNNGTVVFAGMSNTGVPLANGVYYYTLVFYDQGKSVRRVGYFELRR